MILEQAWSVLWWDNARRHRRFFSSEAEARAFGAERELVIDPETITVEDFVDHVYLPLRRLGDGSDRKSGKPLCFDTLAAYSTALRAHVFPVIGNRRLCDLTTEQLRDVMGGARERLEHDGRSYSAMDSELYHLWSLLGSITRLASRLGYCHISAPDRSVISPTTVTAARE